MIALLCFFLTLLVSPLRSKSRVPTANLKRLTATANRLILVPDERSLQVDLVRLDRTRLRWKPRSLSFDTNSTCCGANPGSDWRSAALIAWCLRGSIVWRLEYWTR